MHGAELFGELQTIRARHREIRHQEMNDRGGGSQPHRLHRAFGFQHLVTQLAEDPHLQLAYRLVVIDDQQGPGFAVQSVSHSFSPFCREVLSLASINTTAIVYSIPIAFQFALEPLLAGAPPTPANSHPPDYLWTPPTLALSAFEFSCRSIPRSH